MLLATTPIIEGKRITTYYGIVSGETIIGANVFRDFFASIRDIVGGRSGSYEEVLRQAKDTALKEMSEQARQMGANAVIGVDLDYETVGGSGSMLMVTASGTAVFLEWKYNYMSMIMASFSEKLAIIFIIFLLNDKVEMKLSYDKIQTVSILVYFK